MHNFTFNHMSHNIYIYANVGSGAAMNTCLHVYTSKVPVFGILLQFLVGSVDDTDPVHSALYLRLIWETSSGYKPLSNAVNWT